MKAKNKKNKLRRDTVISDTFHVGIELETFIPCEEGCDREHDDDACQDSYRESIESEGANSILRHYIGLSRDNANAIEPYFDFDSWVRDYVEGWCCEDNDCPYWSSSSDGSERDDLEEKLKELTGNASFKVVSDSSIDCKEDTTDAEVCWNYFASKETITDNTTVLKYLEKEVGARFNTSCGLHINLNNYLKLPELQSVDTSELEFLFNFVGSSRRRSSYCNRQAIGVNEKYSMIYHQGDRLEFRFFSPTFDAEKLHWYVHLANVVYKRLCGKDAKLSKKAMRYFEAKLVTVNGLTPEVAQNSIKKVNSIRSYKSMCSKVEVNLDDSYNAELLDALMGSEESEAV